MHPARLAIIGDRPLIEFFKIPWLRVRRESCNALKRIGPWAVTVKPSTFAIAGTLAVAPLLVLALVLVLLLAPRPALAEEAHARPMEPDAASAASNTARVHVRGTTRIEAHVSRASGRVVLSGAVVDDVGHPASGERLTLKFTRDAGPGGAPTEATVNVSAATPAACAAQTSTGGATAALPPPSLVGPDRLGIAVDAQGRFCATLALASDRYVAHLEAAESDRVDGAKLDLLVDLRVPPVAIVSLAFDPPRPILSLDDPTNDVDVVASIDEDGVTRGAPGLRIALSNEAGAALGEATTAPSGHALLRVESARLGPLGAGELRASFAGSATASASQCSLAVERRARVDLSVADAARAGATLRLQPGNPEESIALRVGATPRCAGTGCAGVPSGAVEARVDDAIVGAAMLDHGQATLLVTFAAPTRPEVPLRIRYLPDAPWFVADNELAAILPIQGPSPWYRGLLALAGIATLFWLAMGRVSAWRGTLRASAKPGRSTGRQAVARIDVLEPLPSHRGWTGVVVDAHEGTPLGGARIAVERRGFERVQVVAEARAGDDGRFTMAPVDPVPGDEIVAEGSLHALLREALPRSGDLRVALILRRRAVLDRMVAWARKRGKPFDARPDPTPGHVRRAAGAESPVGRWADAVERAAFGGEVVDARAHAELEKLSPAASEGVPELPDAAPRPRAR
jgi:hypothetical protein